MVASLKPRLEVITRGQLGNDMSWASFCHPGLFECKPVTVGFKFCAYCVALVTFWNTEQTTDKMQAVDRNHVGIAC